MAGAVLGAARGASRRRARSRRRRPAVARGLGRVVVAAPALRPRRAARAIAAAVRRAAAAAGGVGGAACPRASQPLVNAGLAALGPGALVPRADRGPRGRQRSRAESATRGDRPLRCRRSDVDDVGVHPLRRAASGDAGGAAGVGLAGRSRHGDGTMGRLADGSRRSSRTRARPVGAQRGGLARDHRAVLCRRGVRPVPVAPRAPGGLGHRGAASRDRSPAAKGGERAGGRAVRRGGAVCGAGTDLGAGDVDAGGPPGPANSAGDRAVGAR